MLSTESVAPTASSMRVGWKARQVTGPMRAQIMQLPAWRLYTMQYADGLQHLRENLAAFNLSCLLMLPSMV